MNVTAQLLIDAVGCTPDRAYLFATHLDDACDSFAINTPERLAAFLAQVGHESGGLRYVREIATGEAYEGRRDLGNVQPGDGTRFRGRGLMQITGRDNYIATTGRLVGKFNGSVPNFVDEPEALEQPRWAAISAADWWHSRGLNALADSGDFDRITKIINGGTNGQFDRRQRWERAKRAISALAEKPAFAEPYPKQVQTYQKEVQPTLQIGSDAPEMQGYQALEDAAAGDPAEYPPEQPMPIPALVAALLPSLIESIPKLGALFGSGSDVQQRNVKAAELALSIAQTAVGGANAQDTVERIKSDPSAQAAAARAIDENWFRFEDMREKSVASAREFYAGRERIVAGNMVFHEVLALLMVVISAGGAGAVLFGNFSNELKIAVVTLMIVGGYTGIKEFFFGGSRGSDTKTAMMERRP